MNCNQTLRPISYDLVAGTSITFNMAEQGTAFLQNLEMFTLCDCSYLTEATGSEFVYINIAGTSYNVYDRAGNWLRYGRLLNRKAPNRLRMVFGDDPTDRAHFLVIHDLPCQVLKSSNPAPTA